MVVRGPNLCIFTVFGVFQMFIPRDSFGFFVFVCFFGFPLVFEGFALGKLRILWFVWFRLGFVHFLMFYLKGYISEFTTALTGDMEDRMDKQTLTHMHIEAIKPKDTHQDNQRTQTEKRENQSNKLGNRLKCRPLTITSSERIRV